MADFMGRSGDKSLVKLFLGSDDEEAANAAQEPDLPPLYNADGHALCDFCYRKHGVPKYFRKIKGLIAHIKAEHSGCTLKCDAKYSCENKFESENERAIHKSQYHPLKKKRLN